ncbi:MAG: hypothetical protein Q8R28_10355, partial [Dehalococcoidia bacterium]|nr:hypothetical protein [Dehalococcoidia bacterium]
MPTEEYIGVVHQTRSGFAGQVFTVLHNNAGSLAFAANYVVDPDAAITDLANDAALSADGNYWAIAGQFAVADDAWVLLSRPTQGSLAVSDTYAVAGAHSAVAFTPDNAH